MFTLARPLPPLFFCLRWLVLVLFDFIPQIWYSCNALHLVRM
nr:MAG TPA: hypothetical protein [Caudoviricetes sp.]